MKRWMEVRMSDWTQKKDISTVPVAQKGKEKDRAEVRRQNLTLYLDQIPKRIFTGKVVLRVDALRKIHASSGDVSEEDYQWLKKQFESAPRPPRRKRWGGVDDKLNAVFNPMSSWK